LPNSVKEEIEQQHAAGISMERIMDSEFMLINEINLGINLDIKGAIGKRSQRKSF